MLFLIYVISWYLQLTSRLQFLKAVRFEFLLGSVLLLLSLMKDKVPNISFKPSGLLFIVIFYFVVCLIRVIFSPNIERSWFVFSTYVLKYSCFAIFIYKFVIGPFELKMLLASIFLAWMKLGLEGFVGTITGSMMWMNQGVMRLHGSSGFYSHPNSFSGFAIGTLPFIYFLFKAVKSKILRILLLLQAAFSLNIILHTGSRTGYVAFFILLLCAFFVTQKKIIFSIFLCCIFLVAIPYIPQQYMDRMETIKTGKDKSGQSTEKRKQILADAVYIFLDNPCGVGVGSFPEVRQRYFERSQDTHNLYLQIATNLGIQGLLIFGLMILKIISILSHVIKSVDIQMKKLLEKKIITENEQLYRQANDLEIIKACAEAVRMFIFARLFLGLFGHDLYEIYWWFAIGFTASLYRILQIAEKKTDLVLN